MVEKKLTIQQNMLWNSIGSICYLVCQWLITVLVVRLSEDYEAAGTLALGMAVSNVFTPIGQYKVRPYQVSDIREQFTTPQYVAFRIVTCGISVLIMIVYGTATCEASALPAVFAYGVYSLGPIFVDVLHGADQRAFRMDIIGKSFIARGLLSVLVFSVSLAVFQSLTLSLILMTVATFLVIALFDARETAGICGDITPDFNPKAIRDLFIKCAPAVVAAFISSAIPSFPRQALGAILGTSALGIYASVASPVLIIQMGAQYVYSPLLSEFAIRFDKGDVRSYLSLLAKVTLAMCGITLLGMAGFALFGSWALSLLYGNEIAAYTNLLQPLCICSALTAYIWLLSDLLIAARDLAGNLIGYTISFALCLVTMNPLIAAFGMNGATFVVMASYLAGMAFFLFRLAVKLRALSKK